MQRRHTVSHKHACSRDKDTVMEQYYHHIHSHMAFFLYLPCELESPGLTQLGEYKADNE